MNKISKIIISIMAIIIIALVIVIIVLLNKKDDTKQDNSNDVIKSVVGVYHNNNWNNSEGILVLNDDMTCIYPTDKFACNWTIEDNNIFLKLSYYTNTKNAKIASQWKYSTYEKCKNDLPSAPEFNDLECIYQEGDIKQIILTDNAIVLDKHLFTKVN